MAKLDLATLDRFMERTYATAAGDATTDELFQIVPPGVHEVEDGSILTWGVIVDERGEKHFKLSLTAGPNEEENGEEARERSSDKEIEENEREMEGEQERVNRGRAD